MDRMESIVITVSVILPATISYSKLCCVSKGWDISRYFKKFKNLSKRGRNVFLEISYHKMNLIVQTMNIASKASNKGNSHKRDRETRQLLKCTQNDITSNEQNFPSQIFSFSLTFALWLFAVTTWPPSTTTTPIRSTRIKSTACW